jgi:urease accessory protein UreE
VDVAYREGDILLEQDRFKAVLGGVAVLVVSPIEPQRITGQKAPHDGGNRHRPWSEKEVEMFGNQGQCITEGLRILGYPSQPPQKLIPVSIATE